jgi:hypothetical protein
MSKPYLETIMFSFYYEEQTAPPYLEYKAEVHRIYKPALVLQLGLVAPAVCRFIQPRETKTLPIGDTIISPKFPKNFL